MRRPPRARTLVLLALIVAFAGFLAWRFLRPLNIFVVSPAFERPIDTRAAPAALGTLHSAACGRCHPAFYKEWKTTIHSQAWTDPYFQADWKFDGSKQICKNCHIPLDRQQENVVLGFRDHDKWDPILAPNPGFDAGLQHEGVTCAACHLRDGKILGPYGGLHAPHPVEKLADTNEICVRCHVVQGNRWDTFYRLPPCGTAAEIEAGRGHWHGRSGEFVVRNVSELGCVQCHMPLVTRPLVVGGKVRLARRHLWRGGHDVNMIRRALDVRLREVPSHSATERAFMLTLTNVGAAHYLPTGTPDRHLTVIWRLLDAHGALLRTQTETLERVVMWRPFIVDLWDTRLAYRQPRRYRFEFARNRRPPPATLQVTVRYALLHDSRRRLIGYENTQPISYPVYRQVVRLDARALGARP